MQDRAYPGRRRSSPGYKHVVDYGDDHEACRCYTPCGHDPIGHGSAGGHECASCNEDDAREQSGLVRKVAEVVKGVAVPHGHTPHEGQQEDEHYQRRDADAGQADDASRVDRQRRRHVDQRR